MSVMSRPLALSVGDPSGIGPEIAIAAWQARHDLNVPPFYLLADPDLIVSRARSMGLSVNMALIEPAGAAAQFEAALPVCPLTARMVDQPGAPDQSNAAGTIEAIERAVADVFAGLADAVV